MISKKAKEIIEWNPVAMATVDTDWNPYCIVVADIKVIWENKILICDNFMKTTKQNILNNNKVAFVCWKKDWENDCEWINFIDCVWVKFSWKAEYFSEWEHIETLKPFNVWFPAKWAILITVDKIKEID
ncbi:MAG: hypothetical protein ACD_4C00009G0005 [uncultured bacterium (gcode 4)]|uniref:Uncharacterized protein n=1 Tax=uncultured bacterium (gcode 4) TaxID=1234023 RepID=K2F7R1_9BACT|nr:MAG: hypothetical protein ACD_4C00009G0005 [uncultured bacterium (gcode 4)]